ncbi:uncharacterized protein LOC106136623 [Amyelois transitella]|uniref:uncharacterized protein LOC106136623 n=1 Tax=Amyelois transitella TaxID=680683 RepID=UPI00067CFC3A|nr:uncharacterized protein LOC106136623 [Amyelois transitella]XP_060806238.1 uncharacterized protein LOC106136623 [Amyelois transitella]
MATVRKLFGAHRVACRLFRDDRTLLSCVSVTLVSNRDAHAQNITKNMSYISNEQVKLAVDPNTMKLTKDIKRPLCIIMNWMLQRPSHVMKYASLYLEQGFDVVSVSCTPWQLMWPKTGSQVVGSNLMKFMQANSHSPLVVHGFSVGAYVWAEGLVFAMKDKQTYQPMLDRVVVQTWDSAADITEIPVGFPSAVFPNNKFLQTTFRTYIVYHMKKFYDTATRHYELASQTFHQTPCRAPALFLLSRSDPVGTERSNRDVCDCWVELGMKCTWKCWDRSPHVQHYIKHPQEYLALLYAHLDKHGLISQPDKMRARL